MGPLLLGAVGVLALVAAAVVLRGFGPRYRVGRLLAVVPPVPVARAVELARSGGTRYVRIDGRIDSDAEFQDQDHRPLVLRRTTLRWDASGRGDWRPAAEPAVEVVPFVVREGLEEIEIDAAALDAGLVVVPRVSSGQVADLGALVTAGGVPLHAQAQMVIEQVSSVEHATVLGVPTLGAEGRPVMGPGLGRPLILTTLERDEALRVMTGGAAGRSRLALALLVSGAALVVVAAAWLLVDMLLGGGVATALAASPDPTVRLGTDTRTGGSAGFIGNPGLAILGVLAVGLLSLAGTLAWVRLTGGRARTQAERRARRG